MELRMELKPVLRTKHEEIQVGDTIEMMHKDGRPIRHKVTEFVGDMMYIGDEVVHIGQIEFIRKAEVF